MAVSSLAKVERFVSASNTGLEDKRYVNYFSMISYVTFFQFFQFTFISNSLF